MSDISKLPRRIKRTIWSTYVGQALSVGVLIAGMYSGHSAYVRGIGWLVAWNVFICAVNAGLFLLQGYTREKSRRLLAQVEQFLKEQRPPSPE